MKKLNICIILSNSFNPDFPSRPAITEIYGEYLPSFGHDITWIMPTFKKEEDYQKREFKKIDIYTLYYTNSFFKVYNSISFYFKKYRFFKRLLKKQDYDIIQVRNNIYDSLLILFLKTQYDFVFVFQYSFPKGIYKIRSFSILDYIFGKFEELSINYVLRKADFILPISDWMKKELINKGIPENKMMSLPMGINIKNFSPENKKNLRDKYQLNKKIIFLYIGTLDSSRNIEIIIEAFSKLITNENNTCLLIVGSGNSETKLKKLTSDLNLNDYVIFTGKVSYFEIPDYIFTSDICLSPIPPLPLFKISSPTKLFEYMAMKKPVIANKGILEQDKVLNESGSGILVNFDSDSFAEGMNDLLKNPRKSKEMGENGRKWIVKNRDYEKMTLNLQNLFLKLKRNQNKKK